MALGRATLASSRACLGCTARCGSIDATGNMEHGASVGWIEATLAVHADTGASKASTPGRKSLKCPGCPTSRTRVAHLFRDATRLEIPSTAPSACPLMNDPSTRIWLTANAIIVAIQMRAVTVLASSHWNGASGASCSAISIGSCRRSTCGLEAYDGPAQVRRY